MPQVNMGREVIQTDFTQEEHQAKESSVAAIATKFEPKTSFEQKMAWAAQKSGLSNEQQVMEKEKEYLKTLDPEEAE